MTTGTRERLADRLRSGPISVQEATQISRVLLSALEDAHARGVAHGAIDVRTLVLEEGRPVLASPQPGDPTATDSPADDVYAVAMVLYEALSGSSWTRGADPGAADWSRIPGRLRRVLRKALNPSPKRRWSGPASFQRALWVPRPRDPIWPAVVVLILAAAIIGAIALCKPLGLCWERTEGGAGSPSAQTH